MTDETGDQAAPAESLSDRIASKFGISKLTPPEQGTTQDGETATEPELAEVEWGGKTFKVLPELKEPIIQASDYTRKTQELAEQRRSTEHLREIAQQAKLDNVFSASISAETQEISLIDAYLAQAQKMDWSSMTTDQILRQKVEMDTIKERREGLKAAVTDKRAKFNEELQAKIVELRAKARELAAKSITGFNEDTEKAMRKFAVAEGLSEPEVDSVLLDPRSYRLIWKAMQFDKIKAGTSQAAEKADKASQVLKPGVASERMPAKTADRLNLGKGLKTAKTSGEKANVIEDYLARGMFAKGHT